MKIVIATGNPGKFKELQEMLSVPFVEYVMASEFTTEEPEEIGETYVDNAIVKAKFFATKTGLPAIADDSGLEIVAMGGYPGIISARCAGDNATGDEKVKHILNIMRNEKNRDAMFVCSLAFVHPLHLTIPSTFTGIVEGTILYSPVGKADEGLQYDSIFYYSPFGTTFADVEKWKKNRASHRASACFHMAHYIDGMMRGYNRGFGNL
jgi:XTP/dITP diphosphohydrolase